MSYGELAFFQPHQTFFLNLRVFFIFWCFCMFLCFFNYITLFRPRMSFHSTSNVFFSGWWLAFAFTGPRNFSNQPPQAGDARTFSKIGWVKIDIDNARSFKISIQRWSHILCWRHQSKVLDATESDSDDVPMPENWGMQRPGCWNWTWICVCFLFFLELFYLTLWHLQLWNAL